MITSRPIDISLIANLSADPAYITMENGNVTCFIMALDDPARQIQLVRMTLDGADVPYNYTEM